MRFDFSVGFVNVSEKVEARFELFPKNKRIFQRIKQIIKKATDLPAAFSHCYTYLLHDRSFAHAENDGGG